jgi:hypothetical protein
MAVALQPAQQVPRESIIVKAASATILYTALGAIAASSAYFLGQSLLGRCSLVLLSAGVIVSGAAYAVHSIRSIADANLEELTSKCDLTARVVLWSLLIASALATGFAGGYLLSGASFLLSGAQGSNALAICHGLVDITFTLGYASTLAQFLVRNSTSFYYTYNSVQASLRDAIANFRAHPDQNFGNIVGRLSFVLGNQLDFNTVLEMASHLPEETLREQFLINLPILSNERIAEIITRCPNSFTANFLATHLSAEQWNQIVEPRLTPPFNVEELRAMEEEIQRKELQLARLEERRAQGEDRAPLREEAEAISSRFTQMTSQIIRYREFFRYLPAEDLPIQYAHLQEQINRARPLEPRVAAIHERLMDRAQLQRFQSLVAIQEAADDGEDPNYEVLGAFGFRITDFRALGLALEIPDLYGHDVQKTSERLDQHGLSNRGDLIRNHILDAPLGANPIAEITSRLVAFCRGEIAPIVGEAPLAAPQPRWAAAIRTINQIFNGALSLTLFAIQLVYQPRSTAAGFIAYFLSSTEGGPVNRLYQPAPENINQSFTERMRELYLRISAVTWSVWFGPMGGFFMGLQHANALSHFARRH